MTEIKKLIEQAKRLPKLIKQVIGGLALTAAAATAAAVDSLTTNSPPPSRYQAASLDEVALVSFASSAGLSLYSRSDSEIVLSHHHEETLLTYEILLVLPFTSERKRMGIVVQCRRTGQILFLCKGADCKLGPMIKRAAEAADDDWMAGECDFMARKGLRTLVFARRPLTADQYQQMDAAYQQALRQTVDRDRAVDRVIAEHLEHDMDLVCVTGVEDRLQDQVPETLARLRSRGNGLKIWMLTGDKLETAQCIAVSSSIVKPHERQFPICVQSRAEAAAALDRCEAVAGDDVCLVTDGPSLHFFLSPRFRQQFAQIACRAPAVVCCRCSPEQKADVVRLVRDHGGGDGQQTCAIGDGGNDVPMIRAANVGIGLVGKEGRQASLASDYSITRFSHVARLFLYHGRNSYLRSARLGQFVIHRGLTISFLQACFSATYYWTAVSVFNGFLLVGYATVFTMFPVFALVLDHWPPPSAPTSATSYRQLQRGRALNLRTFFQWTLISLFQGGLIASLCVYLLQAHLWSSVVAITFTSLLLAELVNVAVEIHTWNRLMVLAEFISVLVYGLSIVYLPVGVSVPFVFTGSFVWKTLLITFLSCLPVYLLRLVSSKLSEK